MAKTTIQTITKSITLSKINNILILNGSATDSLTLAVEGSKESISLAVGQTLTLNASTGFVLPDLSISGTGDNLIANVVSTIV